MIESVERLKKFVDVVGNDHCHWKDYYKGVKITLSDLKEALSLIPPYAPGEEIEVSDFPDFREMHTYRAHFIGFNKLGNVVSADDDNVPYLWKYHRPIPKTVDLKGFPVDKVDLAKCLLGKENREVILLDQTRDILKAIVSSAREE